jgi:hypothetical protein
MTPVDPIETALLVARQLDAIGILHTVGGSIASSFAGEPRATIDIDIVAALEEHHVAPLVSALSEEFYVDAGALRRAVRTRSSANLIHQPTQLKVDLFVAGGTPLDARQLAWPWMSVTDEFSTCIRLRTFCCRNCAGTGWAARWRIGNGGISQRLSASRARDSTAGTCARELRFFTYRTFSTARSRRRRPMKGE